MVGKSVRFLNRLFHSGDYIKYPVLGIKKKKIVVYKDRSYI